MADLERRAERVRGNLLTPQEADAADHMIERVTVHLADYVTHLEAAGRSRLYIAETERMIKRLVADLKIHRLCDLEASAVERWLRTQIQAEMSASTRNTYLQAMRGFCNWAVEQGRMVSNPLDAIRKARPDRRRARRALTVDELSRLLRVARERPVQDAMTIRRGPRKGEVAGELQPETRARLEVLGRERTLMYKTMILTGLRKGELASITIGQCHLDGPLPFIELRAADEKNREGSSLPLRTDLAEEIRSWIADKVQSLQDAASKAPTIAFDPEAVSGTRRNGTASQRTQRHAGQLWAAEPLFNVPKALVKILDRDLEAARIPKVDERGRTVDVHALRHTFGTLLSKGGVAPRTAQAAMRHSRIDLTMNVYTDPKLLDIEGALDALPSLSLDGDPEELRATGTAPVDEARNVAPDVAPTLAHRCQIQSIPDHAHEICGADAAEPDGDVTVAVVKRKQPLSISGNGCVRGEQRDSNPRPPEPQSGALTN